MENHAINDLMKITMEKLHELADSNTVVGQPITTADGVTLIPLSNVSLGIGGGGTDYDTRHTSNKGSNFAGGSGAGAKISPVAFLVVKDGFVRVLPIAAPPVSALDRVIDMAPDIMDKVDYFIQKNRGKKEA